MTAERSQADGSPVEAAVRDARLTPSAEAIFREILTTLGQRHSPRYAKDSMAAWRSWELFADHHGLDPMCPDARELVAFVHARALLGISYQHLIWTLAAIEKVLRAARGRRQANEGRGSGADPVVERLLAPARRFLADLWRYGVFAPAQQAPVLTLGEVIAMATNAENELGRLLVIGGYRGALRPGEWVWHAVDHIAVVSLHAIPISGPSTSGSRCRTDPLHGGACGCLQQRGPPSKPEQRRIQCASTHFGADQVHRCRFAG